MTFDEQAVIEYVTKQRWYGAKSRSVTHSEALDSRRRWSRGMRRDGAYHEAWVDDRSEGAQAEDLLTLAPRGFFWFQLKAAELK